MLTKTFLAFCVLCAFVLIGCTKTETTNNSIRRPAIPTRHDHQLNQRHIHWRQGWCTGMRRLHHQVRSVHQRQGAGDGPGPIQLQHEDVARLLAQGSYHAGRQSWSGRSLQNSG